MAGFAPAPDADDADDAPAYDHACPAASNQAQPAHQLPHPHPALLALLALKPDEMRPRDALEALYELHELAQTATDEMPDGVLDETRRA
jgi:hypothetical protein